MDTQQDLVDYAIALGDDALVLGQRLSEWCSHAPFLEEDLALANVALDFIGRARMFYAHAAACEGKGRDEDAIAYLRDCREYRKLTPRPDEETRALLRAWRQQRRLAPSEPVANSQRER